MERGVLHSLTGYPSGSRTGGSSILPTGIRNYNQSGCIKGKECGYLEGYGDRAHTFGSLVMGVYDSGTLIHIGQVGTGFDASTIEMLSAMLSKIRTDKCPFQKISEMKRRMFWTKPEIVIRAGYQEWTKDRRLRVPRFERIRYDEGPDECTIDQ
jgi:bifunctional non-homologous end joining protein LigD